MNSTDRSLALIDYALRRRFYFYQLLPVVDGTASVYEQWLERQDEVSTEDRQELLALFVQLNQQISDRLSPDFQIGHSYFMKEAVHTQAGRDRVWQRAINPLLAEYFHSARDRTGVLSEFQPDRLLATSALHEERFADE